MPNRRKCIGRPGYKAKQARTVLKTRKHKLEAWRKHKEKHPNDKQFLAMEEDLIKRLK